MPSDSDPTSQTNADAFSVALSHHEAGHLAAAERLYRQILDQQPEHAHARHRLGVLALQTGNLHDAVALISQAIMLNGTIPVFHNHLGATLHSLKLLDDAARAVEQALALKPNYADALYNLALIRHDQGRFADSIARAEQALELEPGLPGARDFLRHALQADAIRLEAAGQIDAAIARYRACLPPETVPSAFPDLHTALADPTRASAARIVHQGRREPTPQISVIIPCFNAANTLTRAVKSIIAQEVSAIEIIVVDDLSSDNSLETAITLGRAHPEITVLARRVNGGAGQARNDGIRASRGRFLCFLDADDEYLPGFFRVGLDGLGADPTLSAIRTGIKVIGLAEELDPLSNRAAANSSVTNILVRRAVIDLIGGFPESPIFTGGRGGEDVAVCKILDKYFKTLRDDRPLLIYHVNANSHFSRYLAETRDESGQIVKRRESAEHEVVLMGLGMLMHERVFQERAKAHLSTARPA